MRALRRRPLELRIGATLVGTLFAIAILAPLLAPYDPNEQLDPAAASFRPPGTVLPAVHLRSGAWLLADRVERTPQGLRIVRLGVATQVPAATIANLTATGVAEERAFHLGSDRFGRDVFSRILWGARVSLGIAGGVVVLALAFGVLIGGAAALGGPFVDLVIMRAVDAFVAFPPLFLLIALSAFLQPGLLSLPLILAGLSWMYLARVVRAEILTLRRRDFIVAARSLGLPPATILVRHLLPNALGPVIVQASLLPGSLIALEAALSFLGLGLQPPTASWGNLIAEGQPVMTDAWWLAVFPGAALAFTVIAFNLLGDGLRDVLDPTTLTGSQAAIRLSATRP